jgi:acyl-CoA thioester hydrolase
VLRKIPEGGISGGSVRRVRARTTLYRHRIRYFEADQQGVVFNMWYLGYFDEALTLYLEEGGLTYPAMTRAGYDVQLVHSEIDWQGPLRWPGEAEIEVECDGSGTTSFSLRFQVRSGGDPVALGRTVYVVVGTDGSGKRPIPPALGRALGMVEPIDRGAGEEAAGAEAR